MKWLDLLLIFVGGGSGSVLRYGVGVAMAGVFGGGMPFGTLTVNIIGSFAIGCLAASLPSIEAGGTTSRLLLMTGLLGGFTTFSAFSLDALTLVQRQEMGLALGYIAASLTLSLAAVSLGWFLCRTL